ncbi:archease [Methanocella sp. CWC-04]|uniref:Protein archease n=1 Tax=Methanooceanicella nereidis TaxID=2052831 RepID=A0AAP2RAL6_9EURY|nr:archease [Methanocella sp. CWC-04]MCD1293974.1 archease [Methanocella sp. CWC-04]
MKADFEYLEHTADAEFIAYGRTVDEAFVNAARATFNLIIDAGNVNTDVVRDVEVTDDDLDFLLHGWISELLYLLEVEKLVFGKFEASVKRSDGQYTLTGKAYGEKIDDEKHQISMHIKAVTFHDLRVEKKDNLYEAQILLDI